MFFLLWPKPMSHHVYKTPCPTVTDECEYKEVAPTWRLGGGLDFVCTQAWDGKNDGFNFQLSSCFVDDRWNPDRGHYFIPNDFNVLQATLGSLFLATMLVIFYKIYAMRLNKRR